MRTVFKLIIVILFASLSGCDGYTNSHQNYCSKVKYMVKGSPVPVVQATMDSLQKQVQSSSHINYDDMKAIWISYIDLSTMLTGKTKEQFSSNFETACKNITTAGCNTIYVHVRPFGDAIYNSELFPISLYISGKHMDKPSFDPLKIIIDVAHRYNLSVHAWINPLRLETPEHLSGFDDRYLIKKWYNSDNGYVCKVDGDKHLWLNPGFSEVRKLIADGAAEIAQNYNVDGIHYDDYFYPTTNEGFDIKCYSSLGNGKELSIWRMENISEMVSMIYKAVKSVDKSVVVGVSPQGNMDNNYRYLYADVKKWCSTTGYIDYICPQIYFGYNNPVKPFVQTVGEWEEIMACKDVKLYIGLAVYKTIGTDEEFVNSTGIIAHQIKDLGAFEHCKGYALYNYVSLFSDKMRSKEELDEIIKVNS